MKKLSDVTGMPVICVAGGKQVGNIKEPVFTPKGNKVAGFIITSKGRGNKTGLVFLEDILDIGEDAVLIFDNSSIERKRKLIKEYLKGIKWFFMNKKVITKDGSELGIIKDGAFDEKTGKINEIVLSQGVFEDLRDGRKSLQLTHDTEFGEEFIIVPKGGK